MSACAKGAIWENFPVKNIFEVEIKMVCRNNCRNMKQFYLRLILKENFTKHQIFQSESKRFFGISKTISIKNNV